MALIDVNWRPEERHLRTFGIACTVALAALAGWTAIFDSLLGFEMASERARAVAAGLFAGSGLALVLGLLAPRVLLPLYVLSTLISLPIGYVLSFVIMGLLFYGVFTPIALVFRVAGRDPLKRRFEPEAATYWEPREPVRDVKRYYRQF